jgi:hypothetical protein
MAEAGIATLNHCHNSADPDRLVDEAEAVSRAARDVGVRVAFAVPISGRNPLTYGDPGPLLRPPAPAQAEALRTRPRSGPTPAEQFAMVEEIAGFEHDLFHVQYGPVGPQWVDDAILEKVAEGLRPDGPPRAYAPLRDRLSEGMGRRRLSRRAAESSRRHRPSCPSG